jgi:glyoxylase-like metal-dependent hydrolase (beta-lactamase superfamily II)
MNTTIKTFGEGIHWVETPNTGVMDDPTNMVIVGADPVWLIDPGSPAGLDTVLAALREIGSPRVASILLTHIHIDHGGSADQLSRTLGAPVWFHEAELEELARARHHLSLDRAIAGGEILTLAGRRFEAILTPGHAAGHLSFVDLESSVGIVGDLITGWGSSAIFPPFGNLEDYIRSLDLIRRRGVNPMLPAHGPVVTNGPEALATFIERRNRREEQILGLLASNPLTIEEIRDSLYGEVPHDLIGDVTGNVALHLEKLHREGRVVSDENPNHRQFRLAAPAARGHARS